MNILPRARETGIVTQKLPEELLIFDLDRHKAHCLNRAAAIVWRHCDGHTTTAEAAALLHNELGLPSDERLVWLALDRLARARLLQEQPARPSPVMSESNESRRQVLKQLGRLTVLLPAVATILAPTAAHALSCSTVGGSCASLPCCVGLTCTGPPLFLCV